MLQGENGVIRQKKPAPKVIVKTKEALTKQAGRIAKKADEHEHLINKVTYCLGVVGFGIFCYLLGSRPQDIPYLYCAFFLTATPLRWIYYRSKKWHYFLLDFCYYANLIFTVHLLFFPKREKLFMVCFAFAEGPLAWALIVWRCGLVFSSIDKIVSVLIHLLPGTVIFIIRWWDPSTFTHHAADDTGPWPAWPLVQRGPALWLWMFLVPLAAYTLWQAMYWIYVDGLRKQRLLNDPQVLTSFRELSRKAARANNMWWRVSGLLGDNNRVLMYGFLQAIFTVATMALTIPMFLSYNFHAGFQLFKIAASIWNGGNFFFDVMPRQVQAMAEKKKASLDGKKEGAANGTQEESPAPTLAIPPIPSVLMSANPLDVSDAIEARDGEDQLCASCRSRSLNSLAMSPSASPDNVVMHKSGSAESFPNSGSEGRMSDSMDEEGEEGGKGRTPVVENGAGGEREGGGGEYPWGNAAGLEPGGGELTRRGNFEEGMRMEGLDQTVCAS